MIALIDGDMITFVACHNKKIKDKKGVPILLDGEPVYEDKTLDEMKEVVDSYMKHMIKKSGADKFVMALTRGKCFRYEFYPDYKGNRKQAGMERPQFFYEISQYVMDKYSGVILPGYEADDIIASYKKHYGTEAMVISTDKDLLQCIAGSHFDPKKNVYIATSTYDAEHNFWKSMIVGDTADNIFGLKGKGPAFFQKMITSDECGSLYQKTLKAYFEHYQDFNTAIDEFYKHYKCLHLEDNIDLAVLPQPFNCSDYEL